MKNQTLVSGHFEYIGYVGSQFEKKIDIKPWTERILCAENRVKINHHLGGEAEHTDARRVSPYELKN